MLRMGVWILCHINNSYMGDLRCAFDILPTCRCKFMVYIVCLILYMYIYIIIQYGDAVKPE